MKKLFLSLYLLPLALFGQTQPVRILADCTVPFTFPFAGNTISFDNRFIGCDNWSITWETYGSGAAATLTFQGASSNTAGTGAGTFATYAGTINTGSNPSTSTNGTITATGFSAWVRVNVAGLTGTLRGQLLGCRLPCATPGSSSGGGGGGSVTVTNFPNPQNIAWTSCSSQASFSATASGNVTLVAASGASVPAICHISFAGDTTADYRINNCAATNYTGLYRTILGLALDLPASPLLGTAGEALCLSVGSTVNVGGFVSYRYQ